MQCVLSGCTYKQHCCLAALWPRSILYVLAALWYSNHLTRPKHLHVRLYVLSLQWCTTDYIN